MWTEKFCFVEVIVMLSRKVDLVDRRNNSFINHVAMRIIENASLSGIGEKGVETRN